MDEAKGDGRDRGRTGTGTGAGTGTGTGTGRGRGGAHPGTVFLVQPSLPSNGEVVVPVAVVLELRDIFHLILSSKS